MSTFNVLEIVLKDILLVINPSREDWAIRNQLIADFRTAVDSVESLRGATVEPFGSFLSNLYTQWGDLDISIELPNGAYISSAGKKHKQTLLGHVLNALRSKGGWRKLQFIPNARVPIIKFESYHPNISCDVSINNLKGQMKSKFLFWISGIDGRFRDLVLLVKEWARAHDINNSKTGTLNSYSLSLLVVFHLQTCRPAILPPLKEIYPGNVADDLIGVRAVVEGQIEETSAANINRFKRDRSRAPNRSSLSELFISFLAKFVDITSRASEQGICPYTGQWVDIDSNMRWMPRTYELFVEDPFEQPENTARGVRSRQLQRISEAFQTTHQRLTSANQDQHSLIDTLVRPQIAQFIRRAPSRNSSAYGRNNSRTYPSVPNVANSPLQFQNDFQNRRPQSRPNTTSQRSAPVQARPNSVTMQRSMYTRPGSSTVQRSVQQATQSQSQRVWRPRSDR